MDELSDDFDAIGHDECVSITDHEKVEAENEALQSENERLKGELEQSTSKANLENWMRDCGQAEKDRDQAKAEIISLRAEYQAYRDSVSNGGYVTSLQVEIGRYRAMCERLAGAVDSARKGFDHLGGHLVSYSDKDMGLYGLKGFAFDRREEMYEALATYTQTKNEGSHEK